MSDSTPPKLSKLRFRRIKYGTHPGTNNQTTHTWKLIDNKARTDSAPEPIERHIQFAQKCAWCGGYIYADEATAPYNGDDTQYADWICHAKCNIPLT